MRRMLGCLAMLAVLAGCSGSDEPKGESSYGPLDSLGATDGQETNSEVVGIGRVTVTVPGGLTRTVQPCPTQPASGRGLGCLTLTDEGKREQPSFYISLMPHDQANLGILEDFLESFETDSGVAALAGSACPPSTDCVFPNGRVLVVPSENFALLVSAPPGDEALIATITESVAVVPDAYTTVPLIERGTVNHRVGNLLLDVGLIPTVAGAGIDFEPGGWSARVPVIGLDPAVGSVVSKGSTVSMRLKPRLRP